MESSPHDNIARIKNAAEILPWVVGIRGFVDTKHLYAALEYLAIPESLCDLLLPVQKCPRLVKPTPIEVGGMDIV